MPILALQNEWTEPLDRTHTEVIFVGTNLPQLSNKTMRNNQKVEYSYVYGSNRRDFSWVDLQVRKIRSTYQRD